MIGPPQQSSEAHRAGVSEGRLWFGLLGGAVAWLAHLMGAYVISEFGCVSPLGRQTYLGVGVVAWLLLALTAVTVLVAVAAALVAHRSRLRLGPGEAAGSRLYTARAGLITSGLFALVILVESVPIFYYLRSC